MILRLLLGLSLGVMVGGFIGAAVTGSWAYTIVWAVALAVFVIVGIAVIATWRRSKDGGSRSGRQRTARTIAAVILGLVGAGAVTLPLLIAAMSTAG